MLVKTTGLASGVAITGSATITSSNASSHATSLGSIGVSRGPERERHQGGGRPRDRRGQHQEAAVKGQGLRHPDPAHQEDPEAQAAGTRPRPWPAGALAGTTSTSPRRWR